MQLLHDNITKEYEKQIALSVIILQYLSKGRDIFKSGYPVGGFFKGSEIFSGKFKGYENFPKNCKGYENFPENCKGYEIF